ncbi:ABC transporter ATP-binding protein [Clostridium sp. LY3-2]|uniref:ABC transporter ATP-binding protein n=1 Tax=Clostridium sp. LY3-2 TaxID=2942482 RepID=UPI0021523532|nr:ABC transporter ATP-binding protein [Clostridium sp. LY3-2]MCR6515987.1 ABC transporter ATP-binding protein [Clostridium sp. LY3-2]
MEYVVEMLNIRKEFSGLVANDNITLTLKKGEVHALLGENGAGKSTLMSILFGMYKPDSGKIKINGKEVKINSPNKANEYGIGMVHQHFKLVDTFTVTENIILGCEPKRFKIFLDKEKAAKRIEEISKKYNLNIDPNSKIEDISVGMQQRVEILKMLYREANVLILDEPTAVLTPQEIHELMNIIRDLINEGKSVIIITHKLKEIKEIADRCTVIRKGKYIGTVDVADTSEEKMAKMMVGREVTFKVKKGEAKLREVVLKTENLSVKNNRKVLGLKDFSISIRGGEILGLSGVEGNGQAELVQAITGISKVFSGKIEFLGSDIEKLSIRDRIDKGISYIPEDRHKRGLVLDYNLENNIVLKAYKNKPFSNKGIINKKEIKKYAKEIIKAFDVRSSEEEETIVREMSGGNQQKAIVGREIEMKPELLIAVQPTRGLDVGSIEYIHKRLVEERDKGKAVLLVSLELDEILNLSDRIAVINNGELVGIVDSKDTDENEIGLMMAGIKKEEGRDG